MSEFIYPTLDNLSGAVLSMKIAGVTESEIAQLFRDVEVLRTKLRKKCVVPIKIGKARYVAYVQSISMNRTNDAIASVELLVKPAPPPKLRLPAPAPKPVEASQ